MIETLLTTNNSTLQNASANISDGFASSFEITPVIAAVFVIVFAVFIGSSVQRIEWLHTKLKAFSRSLYYTFIGIATTVTLAAIAYPVYLISQADSQTKTYTLYALGGILAGYVVFTGLGYVVDYVILDTVREYLGRETILPEGENDD